MWHDLVGPSYKENEMLISWEREREEKEKTDIESTVSQAKELV